MAEISHYKISKATNGYIVQMVSRYGADGEPEVFTDFVDAIKHLSGVMGEHNFAETVRQARDLTQSLTAFCAMAVAPQLKAIEAKVNPGVENLVEKDEIQF